MGISRLCHLISHAHKRDMTGNLLRALFQCLQLEVDLPGNLFQWDYTDWHKVVTKSWMSETWRFASTKRIGIQSRGPCITVRRENDQALMPAFLAAGFTKGKLKSLNCCCTFLKVSLVSEIATMPGTHIRPDVLKGQVGDTTFVNHDLDWAVQGRSSPGNWGEWRKALTFLCDGHPSRLRYPLGRWTDNKYKHWKWFLDPQTCRLYRFEPTVGWKYYIHHGHHNRPMGGWFQGPFHHDKYGSCGAERLIYDRRLNCN